MVLVFALRRTLSTELTLITLTCHGGPQTTSGVRQRNESNEVAVYTTPLTEISPLAPSRTQCEKGNSVRRFRSQGSQVLNVSEISVIGDPARINAPFRLAYSLIFLGAVFLVHLLSKDDLAETPLLPLPASHFTRCFLFVSLI